MGVSPLTGKELTTCCQYNYTKSVFLHHIGVKLLAAVGTSIQCNFTLKVLNHTRSVYSHLTEVKCGNTTIIMSYYTEYVIKQFNTRQLDK